ncbi:MAG: GspH/FimT family pseudopilin [Betaproteobacteria bacterium]|nr:GspH/FimT family pseudopilin [Betaproteobacteria bacterium]
MRQRGFSLLELIVVITIIGLAYTLVPKMVFGGVSGAELRSNVRAVAAGLRLAREAAISTKREAVLTLDLDNRTFTVQNDSRVHKLNETLEVKLYTSQADLVTEKIGAIRFYPDGSSNGGRVTVAAGDRSFEVDVDWLTGHVTINDKISTDSRG